MANLEEIRMFGRPASWTARAGTEQDHNNTFSGAAAVVSESKAALFSAQSEIDQIKDDPDLSDEGKRKKIAARTAKIIEDLTKTAEPRIGRVSERLAKQTEKAKAERSQEDRQIAEMRQKEIRELILAQTGGDMRQVIHAYRDANDRGAADVLDAIENAPSPWPGKPDSVTMETLKTERLMTVDPELGDEVAALADAARDSERAYQTAVEEIMALSGEKPTDKLEAIAGGLDDAG